MILTCFEHKIWLQNRFVTKKWIKVYDKSGGNGNVNKETRIKALMLRSDLCDFSDACIVVRGLITVTNPDIAKKKKKKKKQQHLKTMHQLLTALQILMV